MKQSRDYPVMPFGEALDRFISINPRQLEELEHEKGKASPFVKWVGGKRSIIQELVLRLPDTWGHYWEPFVGGGALFFEVYKRIEEATLSDFNLELVITYNTIKRIAPALLEKLEEHARKHSETHYYKVRNRHNLQMPVDVAARFLYLNKTCYNGLYRVNKKGEFNVPMGHYTSPDIVQEDNITLCSMALQKAKIEFREFDTITPKKGDFVYFDPPYHPVGASSFTKYTKLDFSEKDQIRLKDFALKLHKQGVKVMISNSDSPFIRELYPLKFWQIDIVQAPRMVNCKANGRGVVNELIITSYSPWKK